MTALAKDMNDVKQAGIYVDWVDGRMRQPPDVVAVGVADEFQGMARAAHHLMLEDWSRGVE